jgi:predicted acyltransferase
MTVCFMIIVNTPGSEEYAFAPLHHAAWHGFTPTDLVFPSFLFAVGNAMSFSMRKFEGLPDSVVLWKILKRTLLIFLLGYLMYWFPFFRSGEGGVHLLPVSHTRVLGVLQRIALCYGAASILIYYASTRTIYFTAGFLLIGYWLVLLLFPVTGADPFSMTGNAGYRLDKWVLGENHMYHGEGLAFDPEGILSTLPAIVNVVAGYYCGIFIRARGKTYEGLSQLLLGGCFLVFLALWWNGVLPINKKLWTPSYVLLTIGIDLVLLAFLIFIIDFRQKTKWTSFFQVFGKNPLSIYILSELLIVVFFMITVGAGKNLVEWSNDVFFQRGFLQGAFGSLLFSVVYMLVCWSVGKWMDSRKIYIRV